MISGRSNAIIATEGKLAVAVRPHACNEITTIKKMASVGNL